MRILITFLLCCGAVFGQAATAQRFLDAPFSQLTSSVPDGSVRHCINCQKTNPCLVSNSGVQATAEKLNGVWNCAGGGTAASGVNTLTGTANQVIVSAPSGNVTLSAPQDIATTSSPQFLGARLGGSTSGFLRFDQSASPSVSATHTARLYFDTTSQRLKISEDTGTYKFFATFSALTANKIPKFTGTVLDNSNLTDDGTTVRSLIDVRAPKFIVGTGLTEITSPSAAQFTFQGSGASNIDRIFYGNTGKSMAISENGADFSFNLVTTFGATVGAGIFLANSTVDGGFKSVRAAGSVTMRAPDSGGPYTPWTFVLPVTDGTLGQFLRNTTGTGETEWAPIDLAGTSGGLTGILRVDNGGTGLATITSNALIKGNGTSAAVVTGITVDSSNNTSSGGNLKLGVASSVAGNLALEAGSATSVVANNVQIQAPSSVTNYNFVLPSAAGDGVLYNSNSSNVVTQTFVNTETILSTTASVNLNTATPTVLYTCPTGKTCVVTRFIFRVASTSLTTVSFSIGWNSASYNNVIANATRTELTGATIYSVVSAKTGATLGASTETLRLLCNTLQGGAATFTVDTVGFVY